jgi:hypothetical protein
MMALQEENRAKKKSSRKQKAESRKRRAEVITCFVLIKSAIPIGGFAPLGHCDFGNESWGEAPTNYKLLLAPIPPSPPYPYRDRAQARVDGSTDHRPSEEPKKVPYSEVTAQNSVIAMETLMSLAQSYTVLASSIESACALSSTHSRQVS